MSDGNKKSPASKKRKRPAKEAKLTAKVKALATATINAGSTSTEEPGIDEKISSVSRSALTEEIIQRLRKYNITQAELIERSDDKEKALLAGESVVEVVPTAGGNGKVRNNGFTDDLAHAMHVFFDCKSYSVARAYSIEWVFYGVASNTAAAAMAFEMAYNLTLGWALEKKGPSVKHSYTMGVSAGLLQTARIEKKEELRKAEEAEAKALVQRSAEERAQRQKEIERLDLQIQESESEEEEEEEEEVETEQTPTRSVTPQDDHEADTGAHAESDSDAESDNDVGTQADFMEDDEVDLDPFMSVEDYYSEVCKQRKDARKKAPVEEKTPSEEEEPTMDLARTWASGMQLIRFRDSAQKIAEDYIASKNIKVSHCKSRTAAVKDYDAYVHGKVDSKKIDVRSVGKKRIEESSATTGAPSAFG